MLASPQARKRRKGKKAFRKGKKAEKRVARRVGGRRVGGPGKHDVVKGRAKIEVKNRKTPVTRPELIRMKKKGVTQVYSKGGYTKPAVQYGKKRMKLKKL